jgi:hypothetical protein
MTDLKSLLDNSNISDILVDIFCLSFFSVQFKIVLVLSMTGDFSMETWIFACYFETLNLI